MTPLEEAWRVLKALPEDELVQNNYDYASSVHPFLGAGAEVPQLDATSQMRLQTKHPSLSRYPSHLIESVSGTPTNRMLGGSPQLTQLPTDVLRRPGMASVIGIDEGRGRVQEMLAEIENQQNEEALTGGWSPTLIDVENRQLTPDNRHRFRTATFTPPPEFSEQEMQALRQQAQQMPF